MIASILAFLSSGWGKVVGSLAFGASAIAGTIAVLAGARRSGIQTQQVADYRESAQNVEAKQDVTHEVASLSDADVDKRMRKWTRK